ncbi:hypothetical protein [Crocosphaera sp.]|uniref:hypothetical protein n=1 Tax=Crocosphaera sp. TaxID=2729996 RepID=UPI002639BA64|nr:hypothetical protein [Crocosphaera sp.]MDJ0579641.1 hypothetical protein [Crocosphaera sp.]
MLNLTEHQLKKIDGYWVCENCHKRWKSKPKKSSPKCPGVKAYSEIPEYLVSEEDLKWQNLKPIENPLGAKYYRSTGEWVGLYDPNKTTILDPNLPPILKHDERGLLKYSWELENSNLKATETTKISGVVKWFDKYNCCHKWEPLYNKEDCEKLDPNMPDVYYYHDRGDLKFEWELNKLNLGPSENTKPAGMVRWWDKDTETYSWKFLYRVEDCEWKARDNYLTKSTIKKRYLLSEGWIKRLGKPDLTKENPYYPNATPMQLYSRQRVEKYLADHAEKYAKWLDKRDKLVDHYYKFKDKIEAKRKQKKMCNTCRSGITFSTDKGKQFLCVIHPTGLEFLPCPDFSEKEDN